MVLGLSADGAERDHRLTHVRNKRSMMIWFRGKITMKFGVAPFPADILIHELLAHPCARQHAHAEPCWRSALAWSAACSRTAPWVTLAARALGHRGTHIPVHVTAEESGSSFNKLEVDDIFRDQKGPCHGLHRRPFWVRLDLELHEDLMRAETEEAHFLNSWH